MAERRCDFRGASSDIAWNKQYVVGAQEKSNLCIRIMQLMYIIQLQRVDWAGLFDLALASSKIGQSANNLLDTQTLILSQWIPASCCDLFLQSSPLSPSENIPSISNPTVSTKTHANRISSSFECPVPGSLYEGLIFQQPSVMLWHVWVESVLQRPSVMVALKFF